MMERRQFLIIACTLAVVSAIAGSLVSCTSDESGEGESEAEAEAEGEAEAEAEAESESESESECEKGDLTFDSTSIGMPPHSHMFDLSLCDVQDPPTDGITGSTNPDISGHTHTVSLDMSQLDMIAAGSSVTVTTGSGGKNPHTHMFTFQLPTK